MPTKPETGDLVEIQKDARVYKGMLMPRAENEDKEHITIKMDNGYNIGIKIEENGKPVAKIAVLKKSQSSEINVEKRHLTFSPDKPKITLVTTGGTITSKIDYHTGAVTSLMSNDELLDTAPELANIASVSILSPFRKMSENMTPEDWQKLAKIVAEELNKDDVHGVIVTHGTDTLHFTAAALSFMLQNLNKPVILTGSQRSSDRPSSDGPVNLLCAAHLALSNMSEVGICMHASANDDYCIFIRGTKVRKMHTSRRDAFRPINDLSLANVWPNGKIEMSERANKRSDIRVAADAVFKKVALVKIYPGAQPSILEHHVKSGCIGVVIEATGLGHVIWDGEGSWLPTIKSLVKKGIPVCIAPQTLYGRVSPNVYTGLRLLKETGAIFLEDMLPETAYVKLGWVLGHNLPQKAEDKISYVSKEMLKNYAGEINERSLPETFLI